jgi:acyl carrier protein
MGYFIIPDTKDKIRRDEPIRLKESIPIGKGIEDAQLLVLNVAHQLAGIGEMGEIHVRTPYLSKGYVDDEELTARKYIPNPFATEPEDRLYKTGDLGRYLPDGNVEFLGRSDRQIKVRGFRIEPGEIESILMNHESIKQAAIALVSSSYDTELVAWIVCYSNISTLSLRRYLRHYLPDYMIPSHFIVIDAIPLTPNGKVDYGYLQSLPSQQTNTISYMAPQTPMERQIAEIWANILGIEKVSLNDNFFDLGGHSLLITKVVVQLEKCLGVRIPLREFFGQTLAQFTASIEKKVMRNNAVRVSNTS